MLLSAPLLFLLMNFFTDKKKGGWGLELGFTRPFNDWEMEEVCSFLSTIQDKRAHLDEKDKIVWKLSKKGCFTITSLYGALEGRGEDSFPRLMIWNPCVPSKVCFFAWEVWWGKIMTLDQL